MMSITTCLQTVKPVHNSHSQKDQKLVFKTNYHLMQVKSNAECSKGSILKYFRSSLSYLLSLRSLFCLFLSFTVMTNNQVPKCDFKVIWIKYDYESNIPAPVILNLSTLLQKSDKILCKPCIYLILPTCLINSIKHEYHVRYSIFKKTKPTLYIT